MIEAVKFWNEPNNKSHWDLELDPGWTRYAQMVKLACAAVDAESPALTRVLGGISPIDPDFIRCLAAQGVLDRMHAVAVHGFPLDWNHWLVHEWPDKIAEIEAVTALPVWVTEVGVSTFGAFVIAATVGLFGVHDHWTGGYVWTAAISELVAVAAALLSARREGYLTPRVLQHRPHLRGAPQH